MSEKNIKRILFLAFCFSGAAALIYEVVWTRALSLIFGSTVYALSTMLATFMAGLALGGYLGGKLADRVKGGDLVFYFGLFELGIGAVGLAAVPVIYWLPPLYFKLYKSFHLSPGLYFAFQFLLSAGIMLVPTTLMGATFPVVSKRVTAGMEEMGKKVGDAYAANTFGAIIGSLSAGFLLIPLVGVKWSSFAAGCVNIAVGAALVLLSGRVSKKAVLCVIALPVAAYFFVSGAGLRDAFATFYLADRYPDMEFLKEEEGLFRKLSEKDYAEGTVAAYRFNNYLILLHGGKMEGTSAGDIGNTTLLAALPAAAFRGSPKDMLVIGLGAGVTVLMGKKLVEDVGVMEINPGVVEAVRRFGSPGLLDGVALHMGDARRFLSFPGRKYDIITSEPSVPSESVAANLFTKEFYEIASKRLNKGGIFCQWLPGWNLTGEDLDVCVKTFASVFEHTYLWRVSGMGDDFIMTGSMEPLPSPDEVLGRLSDLTAANELGLGERPIELVMPAEAVRSTVAMWDIPLNTDDRPYIEFAVARNFLYGAKFREVRE